MASPVFCTTRTTPGIFARLSADEMSRGKFPCESQSTSSCPGGTNNHSLQPQTLTDQLYDLCIMQYTTHGHMLYNRWNIKYIIVCTYVVSIYHTYVHKCYMLNEGISIVNTICVGKWRWCLGAVHMSEWPWALASKTSEGLIWDTLVFQWHATPITHICIHWRAVGCRHLQVDIPVVVR